MLWTCVLCSYEYNPKDTSECTRCKAPNPNKAQAAPPAPRPNVELAGTMWKCGFCPYEYNLKEVAMCVQCKRPRTTPNNPAMQASAAHSQLSTVVSPRASNPPIYPSSQATVLQSAALVRISVEMNISRNQWICSKCRGMSIWSTNICGNCGEPSPIGAQLQQLFQAI